MDIIALHHETKKLAKDVVWIKDTLGHQLVGGSSPSKARALDTLALRRVTKQLAREVSWIKETLGRQHVDRSSETMLYV